MPQEIVIPVKLDEKTFKRFARFDMFILRKHWVRPLVFSLLLTAFAVIALLIKKEQSGLIAAVRLTVGLGLPIVYFGTFLSQVNMQAVRQRLDPPRAVYTVRLTEQGLEAENKQKKEDPLRLSWAETRRAFRAKGCIYLYVSPVKAFLLPDGQADASDAQVWAYLLEHMGADKCVSRTSTSRP